MEMYAGSTAPTDWLMCDGAAISRETYASLFAIIGTTYGAGDGTTTFNLPDMRDRVPVGAGTTYALNANGGTATETFTDAQIAHGHGFTQPTLPNHAHATDNSSKGFCMIATRAGVSGFRDTAGGSGVHIFGTTGDYSDLGITTSTGGVTSAPSCTGGAVSNLAGGSGSRTTHDNRMPYRGINFIIYAGKTA